MVVFKLRCKTQNYAWGKAGTDSLVARFTKNANSDFGINPQETYAELWMGTHSSGPSEIAEGEFEGQTLSAWLSAHPEALGSKQNGSQLPFLLKVLSIQKALSIQAHPNKSHAEALFKELPDKYPDPNHKPEMAIALTPFEALCGFRPLEQIQAFIKGVPEFRQAIGDVEAEVLLRQGGDAKSALKQCFTALMKSSQHQTSLVHLEKRLTDNIEKGSVDEETRELFLRLCKQFPGDVGCFGAFFFNFLHLEPGQAIFLAANEPHAYLSGDCVECMACSDNVVRAGLTPKWKDVATLCEMLTYEMKSKEENMFVPKNDTADPHVLHFMPPVKDFAITKIQVPEGVHGYSPPSVEGPSLILTTGGTGAYQLEKCQGQLVPGTVLFLSANNRIVLAADKDLVLFQAYEQ